MRSPGDRFFKNVETVFLCATTMAEREAIP